MQKLFGHLLLTWQGRLKIDLLTPFAIVAGVFLVVSNINLGKDYKNGIIEADGKGYYAYLPAVFIYQDLSFGFYYPIERVKYYNPNHYYTYLRLVDGHVVNKYYAGTALCMAPFFLLGHISALVTGAETDGYSWTYTFFTHLGALFYLLLALILLRKLLTVYDVSRINIVIVLVAITFGTSLFYYTVVEFSMSHIYSFAAITAFLYYSKKYMQSPDKWHLVLLGLLAGIITLIRPVNSIIIASLPFLAGSRQSFIAGVRFIFHHYSTLVAGLGAFLLVISIQPVIYLIQTGQGWVYSYPGEGFNFLHPHFRDFLFSYRKGLFVYTPLLLMSLGGFFILIRDRFFEAVSLLVFLILLVYILSSWHMWYYGGSFGQRVMIDYYAFFALLLAILLNQLHKGPFRKILIAVVLLITLFCQIQTYQYRYHQIHWSDMDRKTYWEVFFRLDRLIQ